MQAHQHHASQHSHQKRTSMKKKGRAHKGVATFVSKLADILEYEDNSIVEWSPSGKSFLVHDIKLFSQVLGRYFKSGNFSSFIRQLSFYGYHKNPKHDSAVWEFSHTHFTQHQPEKWTLIKRKTSSEYHARYEQELTKLRDVAKELRAQVRDLSSQLETATSTIATLRAAKDSALSAAQEANRRLAANGLPIVPISTQAVGGAILGTTVTPAAMPAASRVALAVPPQPQQQSNSRTRPRKRRRTLDAAADIDMLAGGMDADGDTTMGGYSAGAGAGAATVSGAGVAPQAPPSVSFNFKDEGLEALPDNLFDGLFSSLDWDTSAAATAAPTPVSSAAGAVQHSISIDDLDDSWFTTDAADGSIAGGSLMPPSLSRSISNLSIGTTPPRPLGSLEVDTFASPLPALSRAQSPTAVLVSNSAVLSAAPPTPAPAAAPLNDVARRVSELSQDEQRRMAVRLFRLLASGAIATATTDNNGTNTSQVVTRGANNHSNSNSNSNNVHNGNHNSNGVANVGASPTPVPKPTSLSLFAKTAATATPTAAAAPPSYLQPASTSLAGTTFSLGQSAATYTNAVANSNNANGSMTATTSLANNGVNSASLEQQVPPQQLLAALLQIPAVSMAVLGTSAVVASAAAAVGAVGAAAAAAPPRSLSPMTVASH